VRSVKSIQAAAGGSRTASYRAEARRKPADRRNGNRQAVSSRDAPYRDFFTTAPPPVAPMPRSLMSPESSAAYAREDGMALRIVECTRRGLPISLSSIVRCAAHLNQIAALHFHGDGFSNGIGRADFHLDLFAVRRRPAGCTALQIVHHGLRLTCRRNAPSASRRMPHQMTRYPWCAAVSTTMLPLGLRWQARANGRGHACSTRIHFAACARIGRVLHRTFFPLG